MIPINKKLITFFVINIAVAILYVASGNIGLIFATESQYSTAIWAPSGIALGVMLVYGLEALPGIFLGSLIVNYHVTISTITTAVGMEALLVGCLIAFGATLQALTGWYLIKKYLGLSNTLNEPNDILLFAFLSGPVSCLVNTSTSTFSLLLLHIISTENFLKSWLTWYIGDSIGVLIFTPIFLILFAKPYKLWHARIIPILIPLTVSFFIVSLIYTFARNNENISSELWFVMLSGLFFCVLINIVLFIIHGQKNLAELKMNEILRSSGEVILGIDMEEKVIFANPTAERMWQHKESELIGKSIHDVILIRNESHDDDCPFTAAFMKNKITLISNQLLLRTNAPEIWVEYICTPFNISNKTTGAVIILNDISKRRESELRLEKLAHFDVLTDLPNRFSFIETLKSSIENRDESHHDLTMCFLDLDNFKLVNDQMGHSTGDLILKHIADLITKDIASSGYCARLGGDEFGIILFNKSMEEINTILEKLIHDISQPTQIGSAAISISVSVGIAPYKESGITAEDLIKNADIAMYRAKDLGKNTYSFFTSEINHEIERARLIETELQYAIINNELQLYYQPQIELSTKKIDGIEVLLRWFSPMLGNIPPAEFIPIAEKNGMIHTIGKWIFEQLARDYPYIKSTFSDQITISVNVAVPQLVDNRLFNQLNTFLDATNLLNSNRLVLEITETAFIHNPKKTISIIKKIKKLGVLFALDDFGINYSSIRYLKTLPVSQIKIDYIFVKDMTEDKNALHIVKAILDLADGLDLPVVAEGVETLDQVNQLSLMGCKYVQGVYYYKPMPLTKLLGIKSNLSG